MDPVTRAAVMLAVEMANSQLIFRVNTVKGNKY
jgi:hypothetical protein